MPIELREHVFYVEVVAKIVISAESREMAEKQMNEMESDQIASHCVCIDWENRKIMLRDTK